jgi:hypothetical protein
MDYRETHGFYLLVCEFAERVSSVLDATEVEITLRFKGDHEPRDPDTENWRVTARPGGSDFNEACGKAWSLAEETGLRFEREGGSKITFYP